MNKWRWKIAFVNNGAQNIETEEPEPPVDVMAFTVTDQLGRRHSFCWHTIMYIISEQIQEPTYAPKPS